MSSNPFSIDVFCNTALSSTLDFGIAGLSGSPPEAANDDDPDPTPPAPERSAVQLPP